jgi:hypothetical protein
MDFFIKIGATPLSNEVSNLEATRKEEGPTGPTGPSSLGPTGPAFYYLNPTGGVTGTGCIMKYGSQVIWNYSFDLPAGPGEPYVISYCPPEIIPSVLPAYTQNFYMCSGGLGTFSMRLLFGENTVSLVGESAGLSLSGTCFANFSYLL